MKSNSDERSTSSTGELMTLGWREWVSLPALGIASIKAKVDTGARTSALHAFEIRTFLENGIERVEFKIHPKQRNQKSVVVCTTDVLDNRQVTDSGGHREDRCVISTDLTLGGQTWPIEMTLTARDDMRFRMLLGRTAISHNALVDPARSYVAGKKPKKRKSGSNK